MAALCAGDDTIGTDDDVAVEVGIHFQRGQNDVIQLVDESALVHRACILASRDGEVVGVGADIVDRVEVKVLRIHQLAGQTAVQQLAHGLGQAADTQTHVDVLLLHDLGQRDGGCDGCAADTGLIREAILEVGGVCNDLSAVLGHQDLALVGGGLCSAGSDLLGDADLVHDADVIHLGLVDLCGVVGVVHEAIGDSDDIVSHLSVHVSIAQDAAVGLAAHTGAVAVLVTGGCADEGDVHMGLAGLNGADTAAVAAHGSQTLELAVGNGVADLAADTGGLNVQDGTVLDHGDQSVMSLAQRACAQGDVLDAHFVDLFHDHADHEVALAEVVVEGDGHAVHCT